MKKTLFFIFIFIIFLLPTDSAFAEDLCILKWEGDKSANYWNGDGNGWSFTDEPSRTQQAAYEAYNLIHQDSNSYGSPSWNDLLCWRLDVGETHLGFLAVSLTWETCLDGTWVFIFTYIDLFSEILLDYDRASGTWDVICGPDSDADGIPDAGDNCPDIFNAVQYDVDSDGIGDVCDPNTVYGTISGDIQGGIIVNIENYSCGVGELVATITTNAEGYYAFGGLENDSYGILPLHSNYIFSPGTVVLQIPQTNIQSYDFTATICNILSDCEDIYDQTMTCPI